MSKKVIITGVTGQDGSHMVDYLLNNTDCIIYGVVRRSSKPDYSNLSEAIKNNRFSLVIGDLSDSQSIDSLTSKIKPDYFINLAAQSFVGSSWQIPEQTMDVNATGVMRCLEAIVRHVPNCRFYNAGSSEEFGDVQYSPQDEKHPLRARSPYGASKIAARQIVKTYRESYNLYAIQGYLFNHEGPRRGEEFVTRKITKGVARIKYAIDNNLPFEPIELGNLDAKRDWSHAKDFVNGIWMMLNQENYRFKKLGKDIDSNGNILDSKTFLKEYVLSSNETHTIREFIELSFKYAGINGVWNGDEFIITTYIGDSRNIKSTILVKTNPQFLRPAEVELLMGNSALARTELGWKPEYNFKSLVEDMVKNDIILSLIKNN